MAYVYDNKTYRNLQQQVKENMDDIARLQNLKLVGLDVSYIVDTEEDLADITAEQGMVVAVGTEQPYTLFVYNDSSWVDFGEFPKAGPQGAQGPQGQVGNPGPRGLTGEPGPRGYTGAAGPAGQPGPQGPRGVQGPAGPKGDPGLVDAFVADAESVTAVGQAYVDEDGYLQVCTSLSPLTFEQGGYVKGPQGEQGIQGPQGIQGEQGVQGPKGDTGPQGEKGAKGDTGARGPEGPQGIQGPQGETGATGPEGAQGPRGPEGAQGPTGPTGPQGPKGDPGLTASVEVNGQVYTTDATGKITLPDYPADVAWGNITGTLSSQTDLQSALDAKADVSAIPTNYVTTDTQQTITGAKTFLATTSAKEPINADYIEGGYGAIGLGWRSASGGGVAKTYLRAGNKNIGTGIVITLPDSSGTLALDRDIPTVGNAKLTIQKNGTNVGTFTANAAISKSINITVPTATSDLTNDSGFITSSAIPTNYVTTDTQQSITASKTIYGDLTITDDDDKTIELIANQTGGLRIEIDDEYETSILGAGELTLKNSNGYGPTIDVAAGQQANTTLTLPSATGTLALQSEIPTVPTNVSAFTNDAGYITSSAIPTNYVTTDTAQTISGAKTFSSAVNLGNGTNIIGDISDCWLNLRNSTGTAYWGRIAATSTELSLFKGIEGIQLFTDRNTGHVHLLPMSNNQNLGSNDVRFWNNLYLSGNISDGTNSVAVANIADKSNSETWTFTLSDNTTVTKTVVLG